MDLLVIALATYRLSSLFATEEGPFNLFSKIRAWTYGHARKLHEGLTCMFCNSVWFGVLLTVLYGLAPKVAFWVCLPLALSTAAIIVKAISEK